MTLRKAAVVPKYYLDKRKDLIAIIDTKLRQGLARKTIASELGIRPDEVTYLAHITPTAARLEKANAPGKTLFAKARLEWARPILEEANRIGLQRAEAAARVGFSEGNVGYWIRKLGITWRNTNGRTVFRFNKTGWLEVVAPLLAQGWTNAQMRDRINKVFKIKVSEITVSRFVLNAGLRTCRHDDTP